MEIYLSSRSCLHASEMASAQVHAWIQHLPEPREQGLSPPSIIYPESSYSSKTTRNIEDIISSLPSPSPSQSPPHLALHLSSSEEGRHSKKRRRREVRATAAEKRHRTSYGSSNLNGSKEPNLINRCVLGTPSQIHTHVAVTDLKCCQS